MMTERHRDGLWDRSEIEAVYGVHHIYSQQKSKVIACSTVALRILKVDGNDYRMTRNIKRRQNWL